MPQSIVNTLHNFAAHFKKKKRNYPSCRKLNKLNANRGQIRQSDKLGDIFLTGRNRTVSVIPSEEAESWCSFLRTYRFSWPRWPRTPSALDTSWKVYNAPLRYTVYIRLFVRIGATLLYNAPFLTILHVWWSIRLINIALRFISERCIKPTIHRLH